MGRWLLEAALLVLARAGRAGVPSSRLAVGRRASGSGVNADPAGVWLQGILFLPSILIIGFLGGWVCQTEAPISDLK